MRQRIGGQPPTKTGVELFALIYELHFCLMNNAYNYNNSLNFGANCDLETNDRFSAGFSIPVISLRKLVIGRITKKGDITRPTFEVLNFKSIL